MKIIRVIDGFITNSSTISTTVIVALKKGKNLAEMLAKLGLSSKYTSRFDEYGSYDEDLAYWVENKEYIDPNIFDLKETYEILQAGIITDGFGDAYDMEDRSSFRRRFYDRIKINDLPLKLDGEDFIFLHRMDYELENEHEMKEDTKNRVWQLVEQLKHPNEKIKPRQPKTYEAFESLEPTQKEVLVELEILTGVRVPFVEAADILKVDDFISSKEQIYLDLFPKVNGFIKKGKDIIALGFNFRMKNRGLKMYPSSIARLPNLKILDLNFFEWTNTPEIFGNHDSVEFLKLPCKTYFNSQPDSIMKLKNLRRLFISHCKGKILPETLGDLKNLEVLSLDYNNSTFYLEEKEGVPTVIPNSIGRLEALRILNLWDNDIKSLPESIGNLKNLQFLNLLGNHISYLPKTFGNLEKLQFLVLRDNPLTKLPSTMSNLKNLKKILIDPVQMDGFKEDPSSMKVINEFKNNNVDLRTIS